MKQNLRKRLACLLLSALLLIGCLPVTAAAVENGFILVAEAGGKLVIAPEYVPYTRRYHFTFFFRLPRVSA